MELKNVASQQKPVYTGLIWGMIGGAVLIIVPTLTRNGYLQIAPYPFILFASVLTARLADKSNIKLGRLFTTGLLTFMVMSLCLYIYIGVYINPNSGITIMGHLLRLSAMLGIGIVSSYMTAILIRLLLMYRTQ